MSEPKYDEDLVNLGYLNRKIDDATKKITFPDNISKHFSSKPQPPYYG